LGTSPSPRSGITIDLVKDTLVLFGGILEITKETDETYFYDVPTNTWSMIEAPANKGADAEDELFARGDTSTKEMMKKGGKHTGSATHLNYSSTNQNSKSNGKKFGHSPSRINESTVKRSNSTTLPAKKLI
jgi:general stress protein YciG